MFWTLLLIWIEVRSAGAPSRTEVLIQAVACGCALTCRMSAAIPVGGFLCWVLVRSPAHAVITGALAVLAFAPWGAFYWAVYHSVLGPSDGQADPGAWAAVPGQHILGVLFSPGRGLLVYHPWLLAIAMLPFVRGADPRGRGLRGWTAFLAITCILHTLLISSWGMWWGGHSYGPRLMTEMVPFILLRCSLQWLWQRRVGRGAVLADWACWASGCTWPVRTFMVCTGTRFPTTSMRHPAPALGLARSTFPVPVSCT